MSRPDRLDVFWAGTGLPPLVGLSSPTVLTVYDVVDQPYLLSLSTWEPRKGLEPLIRAFLHMKSDGLIPHHKLVLVGERGWKDSSIVELARNSAAVVSLGLVEDASLAALYSGAEAFVYPSRYEGFGMSVLEARACGARVVTSDLLELREVGGDDAIYVAPTEEGIRSGIALAVSATAARPIRWRDWDWAGSASILAQVLMDCCNVRTRRLRSLNHAQRARAS